ncbi:DsbA family protein [Microbaculum marinum]
MTVSRRYVLMTGVAGVATLSAGAAAAGFFGNRAVPATGAGDAAVTLVTETPMKLMVAGPLGEQTLGDPNAPVTIVEYASMTCSHCAHFHKETYPQLKEKYIDTGKVYFVFREFPLDPVATAAFMLARCVPEDQYFPFVSALFENQDVWAFTNDRIGGLTKMGKQAGLTEEKFKECLTNQELLDGVNWVKDRGAKEFDVTSTPTFFINGEIVRGALPFEEFEEKITPLLPS